MATTSSGTSEGGNGTDWVVAIEGEATEPNFEEERKTWKKHSIYIVPSSIKGLNPEAYQPQVVSFGPYHREGKGLMAMREHKHRSLVHYLNRNRRKPLRSYVQQLRKVKTQLMDAYDGLDEKWRDDPERFLQLMITDGCFMLEIIRYTNEFNTPPASAAATATTAAAPTAEETKFKDYDSNDPIFSAHGVLNVVPFIRRDMLMIENQVPLLVLAILVSVETDKTNPIGTPRVVDDIVRDGVHRMVLKFLAPSHPPLPTTALGLHALDVFRRSMVRAQGPSPTVHKSVDPKKKQKAANADIIRSAVELNEAGIRFRKSKTKSLQDIQFKHGVLKLPELVVDDLTEFMLLNIMAFERLHVGTGNDVSSYVFFMDNIIDSAKDVTLLASKGIIQNALGSDKAVAHLFNSLSKDVALDPKSDLEEIHELVNEYCSKRWNAWRANLLHTYFRNPWALLSLAAAIFLIFLTVAQTVFAVLQWRQGFNEDNSPPPPPFLGPSLSPSPR